MGRRRDGHELGHDGLPRRQPVGRSPPAAVAGEAVRVDEVELWRWRLSRQWLRVAELMVPPPVVARHGARHLGTEALVDLGEDLARRAARRRSARGRRHRARRGAAPASVATNRPACGASPCRSRSARRCPTPTPRGRRGARPGRAAPRAGPSSAGGGCRGGDAWASRPPTSRRRSARRRRRARSSPCVKALVEPTTSAPSSATRVRSSSRMPRTSSTRSSVYVSPKARPSIVTIAWNSEASMARTSMGTTPASRQRHRPSSAFRAATVGGDGGTGRRPRSADPRAGARGRAGG